MIKTAHINLCEIGSLAVESCTVDSAYPLYRLYDRDMGLRFSPTSAGLDFGVIVAVASADIRAVDMMIIPGSHNLNTFALELLHSDDGASYTSVDSWVQSGNALIARTFTAATKTYWKLKVSSHASVPYFAELFLTAAYQWGRSPDRPTGRLDDEHNVETISTTAGADRFIKHGPPRKLREYRVPFCNSSQYVEITSLNSTWGDGKPFWMYDHTSQWIYGRLQSPVNISLVAYERYSYDFSFIEVIP